VAVPGRTYSMLCVFDEKAATAFYTLALHDALPIWGKAGRAWPARRLRVGLRSPWRRPVRGRRRRRGPRPGCVPDCAGHPLGARRSERSPLSLSLTSGLDSPMRRRRGNRRPGRLRPAVPKHQVDFTDESPWRGEGLPDGAVTVGTSARASSRPADELLEFVLADLADRGAWQLIDEPELARHLEPREPVRAPRGQLLAGRRIVRLGRGHQAFAEDAVG